MSGKKKTLCDWEKDEIKEQIKEYKKLVRNAVFVCRRCGRAANDSSLLCKPVKLDK